MNRPWGVSDTCLVLGQALSLSLSLSVCLSVCLYLCLSLSLSLNYICVLCSTGSVSSTHRVSPDTVNNDGVSVCILMIIFWLSDVIECVYLSYYCPLFLYSPLSFLLSLSLSLSLTRFLSLCMSLFLLILPLSSSSSQGLSWWRWLWRDKGVPPTVRLRCCDLHHLRHRQLTHKPLWVSPLRQRPLPQDPQWPQWSNCHHH